jgi:membrane associated rhomboid family serine protease
MTFRFPRLTSAVRVLLAINVGMFVVNLLYFMASSDNRGLATWLSLSSQRLVQNPFLGIFTFVTYQFIHSLFDPFHILMNMLLLYFLGTVVEEVIGPRRLVWLYLVSGFAGGALWVVISMLVGGPSVVGASGAVYGILVFAACMFPRMEIIFLIVRMPLWILTVILVGIAAYMTALTMRSGSPVGSVADAAHLGGALYGFLLHRSQRWGVAAWASRTLARLSARRRQHKAHRLDDILAKISEHGMTSLSSSERRFLEEESKRRKR